MAPSQRLGDSAPMELRGETAQSEVRPTSDTLVAGAVHPYLDLMRSRRQTSPKRLIEPGPSDEQIHALFEAAAQAPDHGRIRPWRFVLVGEAARPDLGQAFASALRERDPLATPMQLQDARDKALRSPFLALAIARLDDAYAEIPAAERYVSLGCALQNMLLGAHALGYGAGLVSGRAVHSRALRDLFGIEAGELAVCFVAVGSVSQDKPTRERPAPREFVSSL